MIDHVSLGVSDIERSRRFYDAVLAPLGYSRIMNFGGASGYGRDFPGFWLGDHGDKAHASPGAHVAFQAPDRAAVDAFYRAAIAAGAADNGPPGPRPIYHENYYGAFVIDADGNKLEAVCHGPA